MLSTPIQNTISTVGAGTLTDIFLAGIAFVLLAAIASKKLDKIPSFTAYTPTLLTSLGILGTFTGIVAGLMAFNTADIDASIGLLLEGLKTAFITSLAGMLSSIIYKILLATGLLNKKTTDKGIAASEVTAADLYSVMKEQQQNVAKLCDTICNNDTDLSLLHKTLEQQIIGIEDLQKAIGGDNDSSLVGQFKLMRSDMHDNHRSQKKHQQQLTETLSAIHQASESQQEAFKSFEATLWIKLQDFADMLSKSATEQVVEALKSVIEDFNNNLTEQFGENFKQLNAAVHELVNWQNNYKQQLAEMKVQYDQGVEAIAQTETAVAHISEKTQAIPVAMEQLTQVMDVNQHQIDQLSQHLAAFQEIKEKAVNALPEIHTQIETTISGAQKASKTMAKGVEDSTQQLKTAINGSIENYQSTVEKTRTALDATAKTTANASKEIKKQLTTAVTGIDKNLRVMVETLLNDSKSLNKSYKDASQTLVKETEKTSESFQQSVRDMRSSLSKAITDQATKQASETDKILARLDKTIEKTLKDASQSMGQQIDTIDKTMETEVNNVMNAMGTALTSISGQFTNDYTKLVQQMQKVTRQSRESA